jgi:hypothetical protein
MSSLHRGTAYADEIHNCAAARADQRLRREPKRSAKLIDARSTESCRFGNFPFCRFAVFEIFRVTILRFSIIADCLPYSRGPEARIRPLGVWRHRGGYAWRYRIPQLYPHGVFRKATAGHPLSRTALLRLQPRLALGHAPRACHRSNTAPDSFSKFSVPPQIAPHHHDFQPDGCRRFIGALWRWARSVRLRVCGRAPGKRRR